MIIFTITIRIVSEVPKLFSFWLTNEQYEVKIHDCQY